jgi:glycosyltransferase involved in cell wall biosynthesis
VSAKVIFANRYFHPDLSATSQMLSDLAPRLAGLGLEVHVVCSRQLYENPAARLAPCELVNGVNVHRVWTARFGRGRLLGRALDYLSFYVSAGVRMLRLTRRGDVLVVKTDPPLLSLVGAAVAFARGANLVNWLQDVFPEVAARLYARAFPGWLERVLKVLRDRSLRSAKANVVLGVRMREYLASRGISRAGLRIVENWADGTGLQPKAAAESHLRRELALQQRFVVGYSGNLGRAHEFETIVQAASRLRDEPEFVFLIAGGGARLLELQARVAELGLTNFRFLPYQPRAALADSLAAADVHLVSLLPELEGLIVPSKLYGILAAARPAIFIGDRQGEAARILDGAGCGISIACGDGEGLARELRALHCDFATVQAMGRRGRALFESRHTLDRAVQDWVDLLSTHCGLSVTHGPVSATRLSHVAGIIPHP